MVPPTRGLSETSLTSVGDMIEDAFGDDENNIIDLGFIHAILLILTRHLCLLDRTVSVKIHPAHIFQNLPYDGGNIAIGEIKVIAKREKKRKRPNEMALYETTDSVHKTKKRKSPESDDMTNEFEGLDDEVSSTKQTSSKEMEARKERSKPVPKSNKTESSTGLNTDKNDGFAVNEGSKQIRPKDKPNKKKDSIGYKTEDDALSHKDKHSRNESSKQSKQLGSKDKSKEEIHKLDKKVVPDAPESIKKAQSQKEKRAKDNDLSGAIETYQEKILVVERRASTESKTSRSAGYTLNQTPQSLVTKEQYKILADAVKKLQERFGPIDSELIGLYRKSSLSDPMAVIQLSARLEVVERAIHNVMKAVGNLSSTGNIIPSTGFNITATANSLPTTGLSPTAKSLPSTGYSLPSTGYSVPAKVNNLPGTTNNLPSTGYSLPATANNLPSTEYNMSVLANNLPATAKYMPSDGNNLPATFNNLPSTGYSLPATANDLTSTGYNLPATAKNMPSAGNNLPATSNNLPSTGHSLPATAKNLPSTGYNLPATAKNIPSAGYNLPATANNLPSTGHNLPATDNSLPSTGYNLPGTDNNLPSTGYNMPTTVQTSNIPERAIKTLMEDNVKKNFSILMDIKILGTDEVETLRAPSFKSMREYSKDSKDSKASIRKKNDAFSISVSEFESDLLEVEIGSGKVTQSMISSIKFDDDITKPLTMEEFRLILQRFAGDMAKRMQRQYDPISLKSTAAVQDGTLFDNRLTILLNKAQILTNMEKKVKEFVDGVAKLDAKFSSRTSHFYAALQAMQSEIDIALENMAEAMSKPPPVNEAIPQLFYNMNALLMDIQGTNDCQEELIDDQNSMAKRLKVIRMQIHHFEHSKANRDEIDEALKSKISLPMINGLMSLDHFNALIGQLEKYINDLFQRFYTRELNWQKRIDHLWDKIDVKANTTDETALKNDINKNISKMDEHLEFMISICSKKGIESGKYKEITRTEPCISCSTAVKGNHDKLFENSLKQTDTGAENLKTRKLHKAGDESKICRLNFPIPHPIHPGSNCAKFCVRPHKISTDKKIDKLSEELASSIIVRSSTRGETQKVTSEEMRPCEPCNTSEWKKIILNHNLKFTHQQPKSRPLKTQPTVLPQTPERSKDSLASIALKSKRGSTSSSKRRLCHSHPHLQDSESDISEDIIVLNLDED